MKTPKEIKKGLYACGTDECHGKHTECPYEGDGFCIMNVCGDALAYVQYLENKCNEMLGIKGSNKPENRVLTFAGARKQCTKEHFTWIEDEGDVSIGFVTPVDEVDSTVKIYTFFGSFTRKLEDYLKTWRCWKHEPTAEEMKTTPWMTSKPSK